jgi:hypothetical protein
LASRSRSLCRTSETGGLAGSGALGGAVELLGVVVELLPPPLVPPLLLAAVVFLFMTFVFIMENC